MSSLRRYFGAHFVISSRSLQFAKAGSSPDSLFTKLQQILMPAQLFGKGSAVSKVLRNGKKRCEEGETLWSEVRHMSIHPNSSFPLLASDQADVIRIFLELMREGDHAERVPEATTNKKPLGPRTECND
jgi:hypothetical protein